MVGEAEQSLSVEEGTAVHSFAGVPHPVCYDGDLGHTSRVQHKIDTGDTSPFRQSVRCMPQLWHHEAKNQLNDMLSKGVIQPSSTPWVSPVVLVRKKDGSFCFCIDYRKVNSVTEI